ncbi:hypothetical protein QYZ88_003450 [Lachnospiraceae bacterium C1.1]|nr:hypothetical protein [Lachnospiraceae bacterium C1.1]
MYRIYGAIPNDKIDPDLVITEDSNAGHEFFNLLFPGRCISSNGKSNIKRVLSEHSDQALLAIVDGAAFGPEMQDCMELARISNNSISIFAPESFEYLILESGIMEVPKTILEETWNYADSVKYFSWEEFYTKYLSDCTRNQVGQYSKTRLNSFYKTIGCIERIKKTLPDCIKNEL